MYSENQFLTLAFREQVCSIYHYHKVASRILLQHLLHITLYPLLLTTPRSDLAALRFLSQRSHTMDNVQTNKLLTRMFRDQPTVNSYYPSCTLFHVRVSITFKTLKRENLIRVYLALLSLFLVHKYSIFSILRPTKSPAICTLIVSFPGGE